MKTPLALYNLRHQLARTLVSVAGVGFALLLVFMQLGFQGAVSHTATNVYEHMQFDLLIRGTDYAHLYEPGRVPINNLRVAAGLDGVREVVPMWVALQNWRSLPPLEHPQRLQAFRPQFLPLAIMGVQPDDEVFDLPKITDAQRLLTSDQNVLVDDSTRPDYGPLNGRKFSDKDAGREAEVGGQKFKIAGVFKLGTGLAANAAVLTSATGFDRSVPWDAATLVSFGLVRLQADAQPKLVLDQLRTRLGKLGPGDRIAAVDVMTRSDVIRWERQRWLWQTPIGLIFQLGVALSLMVGAAIVYMVLATDVTDRLPEYATLLAMGYTYRYLCTVVLTQAITLGLCGFALAWAVSEVLYRVTGSASGIPITMNVERIVGVGLMGIMVCLVSGTLALRKIWKAEPASLF
ncbi:MAG: FtsX-like permease family protein [Pirellulaceae bacterium]|nr:FtsX-like permease family protein [Pirellulaceae bacterium]